MEQTKPKQQEKENEKYRRWEKVFEANWNRSNNPKIPQYSNQTKFAFNGVCRLFFPSSK